MEDILDTLFQAIEENAFPLFHAQSEYRLEQHRAEQQLQWLKEHLSDEEFAHLEQLLQADMHMVSLECQAEVRLALAVGARLALAA